MVKPSFCPWLCSIPPVPLAAASGRCQAADGIGHRHERGVQRVRHAPDDLVPGRTRQAEGVQHRDEAWIFQGPGRLRSHQDSEI